MGALLQDISYIVAFRSSTGSYSLLRAAVAPDPAEADPRTAVHDLLEALA